MLQVKKFETIFAVMDESNRKKPVLIGTAVAIGKGVFATAGHVTQALVTSKSPTLRQFKDNGTVEVIPIKQSEFWENIDFGLIYADFRPQEIIPWLDAKVSEPTDVDCIGFAYGFDPEREKLIMRHFKGHIICSLRYKSWGEMERTKIGKADYPFETYELSFACPKCLSGAPLFVNLPDGKAIVGIIIGNSKSSMLVHDSTEKISSTKTETVERYESLCLGQAINIQSILNGNSILLANLDKATPDSSKEKLLRIHLGKYVRKIVKA